MPSIGSIKFIGAGVIALVIYLIYLYIVGLQSIALAEKEKSTKLEYSLAAATFKNDTLEFMADTDRLNRAILSNELSQTKEALDEARSLFAKHDLEKLIKSKPGLVATRMHAATERLFDDIEQATED